MKKKMLVFIAGLITGFIALGIILSILASDNAFIPNPYPNYGSMYCSQAFDCFDKYNIDDFAEEEQNRCKTTTDGLECMCYCKDAECNELGLIRCNTEEWNIEKKDK